MQAQRNDTRRLRLPPGWSAWIAAVAVAACGGAAALVVPFFTFGFGFTGDVGGAQHTVALNLAPNAPTTASGLFDPIGSNLTIETQPQIDVTGSYTGCTMTINAPTAAPPLATSYSGRFTSKDVIAMTPLSPAPSASIPVLILLRSNGGTDSRAETC